MKVFRNILLILALALTGQLMAGYTNLITATNYGLSLSMGLSDTRVPENRDFTVSLSLVWKGNRDIELAQPLLSGTRNCEITGNGVEDSSRSTNGMIIRTRKYTYTLRPQGIGQAYFGAASIRYTDGKATRELMTTDIPVTVIMAEIPRKNVAPIVLLVLLGLAALGTGGFFGFRWYKAWKSGKEKSRAAAAAESLSLEEKLFPGFRDLTARRTSFSEKEYFDALMKFFKDYLRKKWGVGKQGISDAELLKSAPEDSPLRDTAGGILDFAHEVKYANLGVTQNDIDRLEKTVDGILKTKN